MYIQIMIQTIMNYLFHLLGIVLLTFTVFYNIVL